MAPPVASVRRGQREAEGSRGKVWGRRLGEVLLSWYLSGGCTMAPLSAVPDLQIPRVPQGDPPKARCQGSRCSCCLAGNRKHTVTICCDPRSALAPCITGLHFSWGQPASPHMPCSVNGQQLGRQLTCLCSLGLERKQTAWHCSICKLFKYSFCSWEFEVEARRGKTNSFDETFWIDCAKVYNLKVVSSFVISDLDGEKREV